MEVILDIKNVPKAIHPTVDSIIVFNGKDWYITSKESLLKEAYELVDNARLELENLKKENKEFKSTVAKQLYDMSELIKKLYGDK